MFRVIFLSGVGSFVFKGVPLFFVPVGHFIADFKVFWFSFASRLKLLQVEHKQTEQQQQKKINRLCAACPSLVKSSEKVLCSYQQKV